MPGIFISYRREDGGGWANHLARDLRAGFGADRVFMDIDRIEAGVDFVHEITQAIVASDVLLAMIGPHWLSAADAQGRRRLELANDFIRLEIAVALSRDIRVIPVLVGGTAMPAADELPEDIRALAQRNAFELTDRRWDADVDQLTGILEKLTGRRRRATPSGSRVERSEGAAPPAKAPRQARPARAAAPERTAPPPPAEPDKDGFGEFAKWVGYGVIGLVVLGMLSNC